MVLLEFGDERVYDAAESDLGRSRSLHEVIALEFESVRAPLPEVVAWLVDNVRVRPGFAELVERRRPLIVSSGFQELIEPVLEREEIAVEVRANGLDTKPEGWRAVFRNHEPCPVCSEPCKRADVAHLHPFAYVGDGFSDRCVALAAARVFARDGLAAYLAAKGVAFEPFDDLHDVERALS